MTKAIFLSLFLLFSSVISGQIEKRIHNALAKRNFSNFNRFIDTYQNNADTPTIRKGNTRELVAGYQEAMYYISNPIPLNDVYISTSARLNIITQGNLIIYYFLESKHLNLASKTFDTIIDTVYKLTDTLRISQLKKAFQKSYLTDLNEDELFMDKISYGLSLHEADVYITNEQKTIDNWVNTNNTDSLTGWLQSTNTEKQVYAVQGFYRLTKKGYHLKQQEADLVKKVINKKGTINTFIPCSTGNTNISSVVKNFRFM